MIASFCQETDPSQRSLSVSLCHCLSVSLSLSGAAQCLWRCYAAQPRSQFIATWNIHIQESSHAHNLSSAISKVARRASASFVKKRRVYKNSMDATGTGSTPTSGVDNPTPAATAAAMEKERKESVESLVFYQDTKGNIGKQVVRWRSVVCCFFSVILFSTFKPNSGGF